VASGGFEPPTHGFSALLKSLSVNSLKKRGLDRGLGYYLNLAPHAGQTLIFLFASFVPHSEHSSHRAAFDPAARSQSPKGMKMIGPMTDRIDAIPITREMRPRNCIKQPPPPLLLRDFILAIVDFLADNLEDH
jgi:hypothetical protein